MKITRWVTHYLAGVPGVCLLAAGLAASPAFAEHTSYHFHYEVNTGVVAIGPGWGGQNAPYFFKIDAPTTPNIVWNQSAVYKADGESWYDFRDLGDTDLKLSIHNPTTDHYTGMAPIIITLHEQATGAQILGSSGLLNTNPAPSWLTWVPSLNRFHMQLPARMTRVIEDEDLIAQNQRQPFTLKIHSPYPGAGKGTFIATTHKGRLQQWRKGWGSDASNFHPSSGFRNYIGYTLPSSNELDGLNSPMLLLPYWRDSNDGATLQNTTWVHLGNVDTADVDITVDVYQLDGTLIKSHTFEDIPPVGRITFVPSQFLDYVSDPREGYLEVKAVRSASPYTAGKIHGMVHHANFSKVETYLWDAYWKIGVKGEALNVVDDG